MNSSILLCRLQQNKKDRIEEKFLVDKKNSIYEKLEQKPFNRYFYGF